MNRGLVCCALLLLVGCRQAPAVSNTTLSLVKAQAQPAALVPVTTAETQLAAPRACATGFTAHTLDYTTATYGDAVGLYDSNGTGVAINDLDNDGKQDIVLANLNGPDTILWNQGNFQFRKETLDDRDSRAVNIVDVDGDGWLDIVFTHRAGGVTFWRNTGKDARTGTRRFVRETLKNVLNPAYAMNWADLNGDGTLDLVTGSYDAALAKEQRDAFLFSDGAGIFYYEHQATTFVPTRLAKQSQALAIAFPDLNRDGQPDLVVGNDFGTPDMTWLRVDADWNAAQPFAATTHSTMSFDWGDINNDGVPELFATDMKPYNLDPRTLASWLPLMATMPKTRDPNDPQITENVLQVLGGDGRWRNEAYERGVDATGWSWSGKFGDLDNDGFLDLYVANGMIAKELFGYLPGNELVEENQARRNDGTGHFMPAPTWGLGSTSSGRGMSMADLNNDGNLDIVVNNLRAPAQLFENRSCSGASIEVDLRQPQTMNTRAIGAQLTLYTSAGRYTRDVRAASGYLSGDSSRVHFGFPANAVVQRLEIRWPDRAISNVAAPRPHALLTVTR